MHKSYAIFALLPCLLLPAGAAFGQATGQSCSLIEEEAKRLLCYDLVFRTDPATPTTSGTPEDAELDPEIAALWPMSSVPVGNTQLISITNVSPETISSSDQFAKLTISCANNSTSLRFIFPGFFMNNDGKGDILQARIDDGDTQRLQVNATDSMLSITSGTASVPLIQRMIAGNSISVTASPSSGPPVQARFSLKGLSQAIRPIRQSCGW